MTLQQLIAQFDSHDIIAMQVGLPDQLRLGAALAVEAPLFPAVPADTTAIFLAGMGGSAIAGDLVRGLWGDVLPVPFLVHRGYDLPTAAGPKSLVICASYSGNTEETLAAYATAKAHGCRIYCITTGGQLLERAKRDGVPYLTIPGGLPPRCAIGYSLAPLLVLLGRSGFTPPAQAAIHLAADALQSRMLSFLPDAGEEFNPAWQLSALLKDRVSIFYAGVERLEGVALRWKGQVNEHAGQPASVVLMPELCHNEIVGWGKGRELREKVVILYLRDPEDHPRIAARFSIVRELLDEAGLTVVDLPAESPDRLSRIMTGVQLADWTAYYLALRNGKDPFEIRAIDRLKDEMAKVR